MNNAYCIIPTYILHDKKLRDKAKLLYGEISSLCNEKGYCYASNKYLAKIYNCSITTISTLISELIKNGYLEVEYIYREGTKEILYRYLKIFKEGISKNLKDNNINNKIIRLKNNREIQKERLNNLIPSWIYKEVEPVIDNKFQTEMEDLFGE